MVERPNGHGIVLDAHLFFREDRRLRGCLLPLVLVRRHVSGRPLELVRAGRRQRPERRAVVIGPRRGAVGAIFSVGLAGGQLIRCEVCPNGFLGCTRSLEVERWVMVVGLKRLWWMILKPHLK